MGGAPVIQAPKLRSFESCAMNLATLLRLRLSVSACVACREYLETPSVP